MLSLPPAFLAAATRRAHSSPRGRSASSRDSISESASSRVSPSEERVGFEFEDIRRNRTLRAQCASNDVSERRANRLCGSHAALANLFVDQGVVQSELLQMAIAQPVAAAVANIEHPCAAPLGHQRHHGGAHAAQPEVAPGAGEDGFIGRIDSSLGPLQQRFGLIPDLAAEQAQYLVYRQRTGNLSRSRAAHAVADEIDPVLDRVTECVFIGGALATAVGSRRSRKVDDSRSQGSLSSASVYTDSEAA